MASTTTQALRARASAALDEGDTIDALRYAGEVLRFAPRDHHARMIAGRALNAVGRPDEANAAFRVAADALGEAGFLLSAIAACHDAQAIWPDDLDLIAAVGRLHERISGLPPTGRAHVPPPEPPQEVSTDGGGSLLRFSDDDLLISTAAELATDEKAAMGISVAPTAVPLFSELSTEAFVSLLGELHHRRIPAGQTIVEQGDAGTSLFVLIAGEVAVSRDGSTLAKLPAGALFGEMALVTQQPRTATVTTTRDVELFEIDVEHVERVAASHPAITKDLVDFARRRMLMNLMATSPIFQPFDRAQRSAILGRFRSRVAPEGTVIIAEGADPFGLCLVASGEVRIEKVDEAGAPKLLAHLREGDVFGEIALTTHGKTTATATATTKTVLLVLERAQFDEFVAKHPAIAAYLDALSSDRVEETRQVMAGEELFDADDLILI